MKNTKSTTQKATFTGAYSEETSSLEFLSDFEGNIFTSPVNVVLTNLAPEFELNIFMPLGKRIIIFEQDFTLKGIGRITRTVKIRNTGVDLTAAKNKLYSRNVCCTFPWLDEAIDPENPEKLVGADGAEVLDGVFSYNGLTTNDGANITSVQVVEIGEEGASPNQDETDQFTLDIKAPFIIGGEPRVVVGTNPDSKMGTVLSIKFKLEKLGGGAPGS